MTQSVIDFSWGVDRDDQKVFVRAEGELDVYWAPGFRDALFHLIEGQDEMYVEVDLEGVTFVDSTGLGVLVGTQRRLMERGGELVLTNLPGPTQKALEVSGLLSHFRIRNDSG
jgi:anti-anti-sigma factor